MRGSGGESDCAKGTLTREPVDDEAVSVERFRLLVVLAGFPVNALFAQANGGEFKLRIEDTDRERSTPEATQAIPQSGALQEFLQLATKFGRIPTGVDRSSQKPALASREAPFELGAATGQG